MSAHMGGSFHKTPKTADGMRALGAAWTPMEEMIRRIARSMAQDGDDEEDLVQEAIIELMELEPSRYNMNNPRDHAYLREILIHKMWKVRGTDQCGDEIMAASMRAPMAEWIPKAGSRVE